MWRGVDYLGVGPGAHGRLTRGGIRHAARTAPRIADYIARVTETGSGVEADEPLSAREVAEERVMLGLRIAEGLPAAVLAGLGLTPDLRPLADLLDSGLLRLDGDRIAATTPGRLVLDRVISELLTA